MRLEFDLSKERDKIVEVNELVDDFVEKLKLLGVQIISHNKLPQETKGGAR